MEEGRAREPRGGYPLLALRRSARGKTGRMIVVHRKSRTRLPAKTAAPGVEVLDLKHFVWELAPGSVHSPHL
jgi:hypothetical protein